MCIRDRFEGMKDATEGYRNFLGLASHEYFHSWNVKRIKPAAFVPYDLTQENYTRLLWAFEGFPSAIPAAEPRNTKAAPSSGSPASYCEAPTITSS